MPNASNQAVQVIAEYVSNGYSCRSAMKIGALGALFTGAAVSRMPRAMAAESLDNEIKKNKVKVYDDFPNEISPDYKPFNQEKRIFTQAFMNTNP